MKPIVAFGHPDDTSPISSMRSEKDDIAIFDLNCCCIVDRFNGIGYIFLSKDRVPFIALDNAVQTAFSLVMDPLI